MSHFLRRFALLSLSLLMLTSFAPLPSAADELTKKAFRTAKPKVVKIYGAGGFAGFEDYQSGMIISADGLVLTAFTSTLDASNLRVVLDNGERYDAELLDADLKLEVAVLKLKDAAALSFFNLDDVAVPKIGESILILGNFFKIAQGSEPVSLLHGVVCAKSTLDGKSGAFETPYSGPIYVLDAIANNPGGAGGVLINRQGELLGMLGKEVKHAKTNTYLNFAIPISAIKPTVDAIIEGKERPKAQPVLGAAAEEDLEKLPKEPHTLGGLGITPVPDVLQRTPPFIDRIEPGTPAHRAGLRPDDLVVLVGDSLIPSLRKLRDSLRRVDRIDPLVMTVLRKGELIEVQMVNR